MPFKSQKQRAYFYKFMPEKAKEWEAHTPKGKKLPKKIERRKENARKNKRMGRRGKKKK